jgi:Tfp pilus assembly protein PilN
MNESAVNFLPEDYVEKRVAGRWTFICIGLCIAVMCVVFGTFFMQMRTKAAAQEALDQVNHEYEEAGKRLAEMQTLEHEKQTMMVKAEVTAVLLERVPRSVLLAELTKLMPKGVSLISMELKTHEATEPHRANRLEAARRQMEGTPENQAAPRAPDKEVSLELVGMSPSDGQVAAFISALGKSALLEDVNLVFSEEFANNNETLRRFRVDMRINPDADIRTTGNDTTKVQKS